MASSCTPGSPAWHSRWYSVLLALSVLAILTAHGAEAKTHKAKQLSYSQKKHSTGESACRAELGWAGLAGWYRSEGLGPARPFARASARAGGGRLLVHPCYLSAIADLLDFVLCSQRGPVCFAPGWGCQAERWAVHLHQRRHRQEPSLHRTRACLHVDFLTCSSADFLKDPFSCYCPQADGNNVVPASGAGTQVALKRHPNKKTRWLQIHLQGGKTKCLSSQWGGAGDEAAVAYQCNNSGLEKTKQ